MVRQGPYLILPTVAELRLPIPSIDDLVKYYVPGLGRRPAFIESFPEELRPVIADTLRSIIRRHSPVADPRRRTEVLTVGVTSGQLRDELLAALPWIRIKFPNLHRTQFVIC